MARRLPRGTAPLQTPLRQGATHLLLLSSEPVDKTAGKERYHKAIKSLRAGRIASVRQHQRERLEGLDPSRWRLVAPAAGLAYSASCTDGAMLRAYADEGHRSFSEWWQRA